MIEIDAVTKSFGDTPVLAELSLSVRRGEVLVLLGPSGCGKTTLLRMISGLDRPDAGRIAIDGTIVSGPSTWVPPEKRQVGMVFQDWALFPHLTVRENVAFGLKGHPHRDDRVAEMLAMVDLGSLGDRQPGTLSGGQQQRVALARSLAPSPQVLLLDEPFSNLDAGLRTQLRTDLRVLLREFDITSVFVTHDREEALELGDRLAIFNHGSLVQVADPVTVYEQPASAWAARLVGDANLLSASADGTVAHTIVGTLPLEEPATGTIEVLVRPEAVLLEPASLAAEGTGVDGVVTLVRYRGNETMYHVGVGDSVVVARDHRPPMFALGDAVRVAVDQSPARAWPSTLA